MDRRRTRSNRTDQDESRGDPAASTPSKRQRVSIACDSCRMAKGKCDGDRPRCGTCAMHNRNCSYTHAARKRGVPSGYLKSIEVSIGWLFEQYPGSEAALHRFLTQNDGADGVRVLVNKDETGGRFYRRWTKSSVCKDIGRLISDRRRLQRDISVDGSEPQENTSPTSPLFLESQQTTGLDAHGGSLSLPDPPTTDPFQPPQNPNTIPTHRHITLPSNWSHLVDVYFAYTSCWLPIIKRDSVISTASLYPRQGLRLNSTHSSPLHAQLWAVLAVASFQDAAASTSPNGSLSPNQIFSTACNLSATDQENSEAPYISSLLLQSLIRLGQRNEVEAWLLIGKASRLALSGLSATTPNTLAAQDGSAVPCHMARILAAANILDTLVSLCLGHPGMVGSGRYPLPSDPVTDPVNTTDSWGLLLSPEHSVRGQLPLSPLAAFRQLYIFSQLWVKSPHSPKTTPGDLLQSLGPQFSFCNSLIFGGLTPAVPSAFLIQAMFLTISLGLALGPRPALLSNLLQLVELCIDNLGPFGTPSLMITLVEIIHRSDQSDRVYEEEKARWMTVMDSLQDVWRADTSRNNFVLREQNTESRVDTNQATESPLAHNTAGLVLPTLDSSNDQQYDDIQPQINVLDASNQPHSASNRQAYTANVTGLKLPPRISLSPSTSHPPALSEEHDRSLRGNPEMSQQIEYDAILEELGTIDYADVTDANSQFMSNLGYVPGYDLRDMFLNDFGA
ncbi:hypothetical protein EDB81DRAFT_695357 [Dactylonectria macrodidyma]|uniref:Zn(2)-C6 fungal-type domain-containing protein n=1 Tax=Dactylonectria macrodidyma TaxID=307937 RepID=A0A9P9IWM8_9HYPO|nr:hypothetical protein EDB81DRAFT_695357 [Dactylonectria macrodidyma]